MGFKESINGFLGLCNEGECPFRITVLGSLGVFIEGVKKILNLKPNVVVVSVKGGAIAVYGEGLFLGSYVERDLTIKGKVEKIEWQD